jgi:hypothetical protein
MRQDGIRLASVVCALFATAAIAADERIESLEQQCELAREAKIKPLRDAEIAKCQADKRNDPAYCERYWSDYGDAGRTVDGRFRPRLFDDLPECVAADEARRHKNEE